MKKLRGLDLYCGGGGCSVGYARAGFEMVGVDLWPQKNYPYEFVQADALEFVRAHGREYDFVHASPPCQAHSQATKCWSGVNGKREHPDLIPATRAALRATGKPYVIENVPGARKHLLHPVTLCGTFFGLKVYRHRLFESNLLLWQPEHTTHPERVPLAGRGASEGGYISVAGNFSDVRAARLAMDIDWMSRDELSQAIPPAYTQYIGHQLRWHLDAAT